MGLLRIGVQECRLDEEDLGAFDELNDLFLISYGKRAIHDIGDLAA